MNTKSSIKGTPSPAAVAAKAAATLLDFAINVESSASTDKIIDPSDLEHYTLRANDPSKFPAGALAPDTARQLESIGRRIWNIFVRKQNCSIEAEEQTEQCQFYLRARLFGYLILGIGLLGRPDANATQSAPYLTRLGLALSKVCINHADLESARIALQKVTEYLPPSPSGTAPESSDGPGQADQASYYILRMALSWKDDCLDLTEHMYTKATQHTSYIDTGTRRTLVHLLMQIANSFIAKSNPTAAVPWFRRAAEKSSLCLSDRNTLNAMALSMHEQTRLAALCALVKCLTRLKSREALEEASRVVMLAQEEFGERRIEVLEMLVMVQAANGDAGDALTELLEALLP